MRITPLIISFLLLLCMQTYAQPKKPTIMILPSDNWLTQRYFMTSYNNQGLDVKIPNYQQAFMEDTELPQVISKIGGILTELGYSLKDAEQEIKNINQKSIEEKTITSKSSNSALQESTLDILKRRIKSDILIQVWWKVNQESNGHSASFILEAFDAYTNKRIATSTGTTEASTEIIPVLLEQAIKTNIIPFDTQMGKWYENQQNNGREISLTIKCWENWENDLETEYNNNELTDCIQEWLHNNTVNGAFNLTDGTESFIQFEQVHIPLYDRNEHALDARGFAVELRKHLQKPPFNITSKVIVRGLGEAIIILGEK